MKSSVRRLRGIRGVGITLAVGAALFGCAMAAQGDASPGANAAATAGAGEAVSTTALPAADTQAAAASAAAAPTAAPAAASNTPVAGYLADPAAMRRGKLLFIGSCGAYCHSTKNVERDAPSLFDCEWRHGGSEQEIHDSIANGVPNTRMPAWKGVLPEGDDDIWKLVAYLKSTSTCGAPPA